MSSKPRKRPAIWLKKHYPKIEILDPDGWDRSAEGWDKSWNRRITQDEFERRLSFSTCAFHGPIEECFKPINL